MSDCGLLSQALLQTRATVTRAIDISQGGPYRTASMRGGGFGSTGGTSIAVLGTGGPSVSAHADCFADEVVIDFPSVASAVERMRSAFVDEMPRVPMTAEVSLSPRQALEGARVPLSVPVCCTCPACGGRGERWPDRCARCAGTGAELRRHQVQVSVPARVAHGARFRFLVAPRHDPPTRVELRVAIR